jgi:hypothetical protein
MTPTEVPVIGTLPVPGASSSVLEQIDRAEQQWKAHGIVSYQLAGTQMTFGPSFAYKVTVKNGTIASASCHLPGADTQPCPSFTPDGLTIDGLFTKARRAAGDPKKSVTITFDATYNYPTRLSVDVPGRADSQITWTITSFEALP